MMIQSYFLNRISNRRIILSTIIIVLLLCSTYTVASDCSSEMLKNESQLNKCQIKAQQGDPQDQYNLAKLYRSGTSAAEYEQALIWAEK